MLNAFVRHADVVKMANMAQLVNVIAPIFTDERTLFKQTIYYPLQLFAQNVYGTSLDVFVDCDTYDTERFSLGLNIIFGHFSCKIRKVQLLGCFGSIFSTRFKSVRLSQCGIIFGEHFLDIG